MKTPIFLLIISTFCIIVESSHKWEELPKSSGKIGFENTFKQASVDRPRTWNDLDLVALVPRQNIEPRSDSYRSAEACFQELIEFSIGSENDFEVKENWK